MVIGSRAAERAQESAAKLLELVPGAQAEGLANPEAAARGPIVVLTVPFRNQSENLTNLKAVLEPGQIVIDATVPLAAAVSGKATRLLGVPQGSAAEQAQEMVPEGVHVVAALHTVNASHLADLDTELSEDVPVAGDDKESRRRAIELIETVPGLRCVDCGRLEAARQIEALTPLLIRINVVNKAKAGIKITGL